MNLLMLCQFCNFLAISCCAHSIPWSNAIKDGKILLKNDVLEFKSNSDLKSKDIGLETHLLPIFMYNDKPKTRTRRDTNPDYNERMLEKAKISGRWHKSRLTYSILSFAFNIPKDKQRLAIARAFRYWSDVTTLSFREVPGYKADIRLQFVRYHHYETYYRHSCATPFDGPWATSTTRSGNRFAHAYPPPYGDIHFDASEDWVIQSNDGVDLETIATHEIGHALGLAHSTEEGSVMLSHYHGYDPDFKLSTLDINRIQQMYGINSKWRHQQQYSDKKENTLPVFPLKPHISVHAHSTDQPSPDACSTQFDAIFQGPDGTIYAFVDEWVWILDRNSVTPGYPMLSMNVFKHAEVNPGAAVFSKNTGYTYMFFGTSVHQYDGFRLIQMKNLSLRDRNFPEAAFTGFTGQIYLLKGRHYWIFDEKTLDVTTPYKRRIRDTWPEAPHHVTAAMTVDEYHVQFFVGHKYWTYDLILKRFTKETPQDKINGVMEHMCTNEF